MRSDSGARVLFNGVVENAAEIAARLKLASTVDAATLYGAAVDCWGIDADRHVVGRYCAILAWPDRLRLSRSPWDSPPLHYAQFDGMAVAASVPRVLIAAGLPEKLDRTKLADNLFFNLLDRERGWFEGARRVPHGCIVELDRAGASTSDFYDLAGLPEVRFRHDHEYVDAARELLQEAVAKALKQTDRPAIQLSGGLDSSILADEVLRQMPPERSLPSYTFVPLADHSIGARPGMYNSDRELVEAFAAAHPRLVPSFLDNRDRPFDSRWTDMFLAMGGAPNYLVNFFPYQAMWEEARHRGCDSMLTGEFGNQTISNNGRTSYVEFLLSGRWHELYLALANRPDDQRTLLHRFVSLSLVRLLPLRARLALRRRRHSRAATFNEAMSMMPVAATNDAWERAIETGAIAQEEYFSSKRAALAFEYRWRDCDGGDLEQAFEQIYGMPQIDVYCYRPLVEFCAGVPTTQFMRGGVGRWLARRLAEGRLPEAQRTNPRSADHNVEWQLRLGRQRENLRETIARIADQPDLADLFDTERMTALIDAWDEGDPREPEVRLTREAGLMRAIATGRFIEFVRKSNR
ncbi:MAG: hypothetical protein JF593_09170 [Novosphingobium sp.]|nr:hypothetical protein [Novosphingobium sp.]